MSVTTSTTTGLSAAKALARAPLNSLGFSTRSPRQPKSSATLANLSLIEHPDIAASRTTGYPWLPGISMCTGPGVPKVATRKACLRRSGSRWGRSTRALNFVIDWNIGQSSTTWYRYLYQESG